MQKQLIKPKEIKSDFFENEKDKDLGFGEKVATESRDRLLNRDGTFNVERTGMPFWSSLSLYHVLLTMSWRNFLVLMLLLYFLSNVFFGLLYSAFGENALVDTSTNPTENIYLRGFFFSVQTFATIGYGTIHPVGFVPNLLVTIESYYSLIANALITGIVFARFARPTAKIIFSEVAVITPFQERTALMCRIVNARITQLIEVEAKVMFSRIVEENGRQVRRFDMLDLERQRVSFLPLSWTIVHLIDENSPLYGMTKEDFVSTNVEIAFLISGMDETYAQIVHARTSYKSPEVYFNYKFADIYNANEAGERISIDVRKLSKTEKL